MRIEQTKEVKHNVDSLVEYQGVFKKSRGYVYKIISCFKTHDGHVYDIESVSKPSGLLCNQHAEKLCSVKHGELIKV